MYIYIFISNPTLHENKCVKHMICRLSRHHILCAYGGLSRCAANRISLMNQMSRRQDANPKWVETTKDGLRISKLDALWFSKMASWEISGAKWKFQWENHPRGFPVPCAPEGGCLFCTRITVAFIVVQL